MYFYLSNPIRYKKWKQGQVAWEEYRDTLQVCRDGVRKTKVFLGLNLVRGTKGSTKDYYRCISSGNKTRENMGLLLNGVGDQMIKT